MKVLMGMGVMFFPLLLGALFMLGTAILWIRQRSLPTFLLFLGFTGPLVAFLLPGGHGAAEWRPVLSVVCGLLQVAGIFGLAAQPTAAAVAPD